MKANTFLSLLVFFWVVPGVLFGYPDREQLQREMAQLEAYLRKAQAAEGPECAPESLAAAQAYLARAKEEFAEGDFWEVEDAIRLCEKEAEGIAEKILLCGRDPDRDGIPDLRDRCPDDPESYNGYMDEDGCPDRMPRKAVLTEDRIEILVPIDFDPETQEPVVPPDSVLHEVARIMEDNPDVRVLVQAHMDTGVPAGVADETTRIRANHVKSLLVELGIAEDRLESVGRGSHEPVASNDSTWGRTLNSRVEFIRIP